MKLWRGVNVFNRLYYSGLEKDVLLEVYDEYEGSTSARNDK